MTFLREAQKEWDKLDGRVREQFARKLRERREHPHVPSAKLGGWPQCYKIKLRTVGYRLVYRVFDDRIVVQVIAIGRRDKDEAYRRAAERLF